MLVKKGKQIKLNEFNNYNIVIGTVDNKNPKSLFFNISSWAEPLKINEDNHVVIKDLNKLIKKKTYDFLNKNLFNSNQIIVDFEIKESGLSLNKRSYMNCEITLFKLNNFKLQNELINESLNKLINDLIENIFDNNEYFRFHKTKK